MAYNTKVQLMLYKFENSQFVKKAIIDDYYEISFTRNYYEAGDFTITINKNIPNASLFKKGLFVRFGNDNYDMGEIISISNSVGPEGKASETLIINGKDLRYIFHRRVIRQDNANGNWEMTGAGEIVMRSLIRDQCGSGAEAKRRLPVTNIIPENGIGDTCSISEAFTNLYEVLITIATQTNTGWRIRFDGTMTLEFFRGIDRSTNVFFTVSHDALQDGTFTDSSESYANTIYVGGQGQGDERDIYEGETGSPEGFDRFEAWDDQSSMTSEAEYRAEANAMLTQYGQTLMVSGNVLAKNPYVYKQEYDVGDLIRIGFSGQEATVQILSVTENWSGRGNYNITFEFGKPINTLANQLQLMLRQIRKASDKTSSTDSVRWYTIPTDTEMPKADVTFNTIGFIGDCGNDGKTFKLYFDENGTGSKSYHVWFKQLAGGKLTLTTGVEGKQNLEMDSGTYVAIIYVDQEGNVLNQANAVSVNSGGQSVGTASTINVNGKTYDIGGSGSGIPLGGWTSFENDTAPNTEWLQAGTTFDSDTYPELFLYLGGNTVPKWNEGEGERTSFGYPYNSSEQSYTLNNFSSYKTMVLNNASPYNTSPNSTGTWFISDNGSSYIDLEHYRQWLVDNNYTGYPQYGSSGSGRDAIGMSNVSWDKVTDVFTFTLKTRAVVSFIKKPKIRFIKATTTASSYTPSSAVQEIKDYTKDYVDAKNSYSTEETLTGGTWIDGKPIYKITKEGTGNFSNSNWTNITLFNDGIQKKVVKIDMICNTCCLRPQSFEITNTLAFSTATSSGSGSTANNAKYILTILYTKTTD